MYKTLNKLSLRITKITSFISVVVAIVMIVSSLYGVVLRYVFNSSPTWTDEIALLAFCWFSLLVASVLVQEREHVKITFLVSVLPLFLQKLINSLNEILIILFSLLMIWAGWNYTELTFYQTSAAIQYPLWIRSVSVPVSGVLILFHTVIALFAQSKINKSNQAIIGNEYE